MSFPLVGNEKVRYTVESFLASSRLPHAIIISGEAGLGKHTLAKYIAKSAVCTGDKKPCGVCHGCETSEKGLHPDITFVTREKDKKEISVKIIRDVRSEAFVVPHEAPKKVFIIEEAERMNTSAQNALLKVLEEPPEYVVFILLCSVRSALLPTVLSRCINLSLSPALGEEAEEVVKSLAGCDTSAAAEALYTTHGNIGKAVAAITRHSENIAGSTAKAFLDMMFERDEYGMLKALSAFEKDRAATDLFFSELKYEICERVKSLPKNGRRAKALFSLFCDIDRFSESAKLNANLSLLFCSLVVTANNYMR